LLGAPRALWFRGAPKFNYTTPAAFLSSEICKKFAQIFILKFGYSAYCVFDSYHL
jgi:hypothetical protein